MLWSHSLPGQQVQFQPSLIVIMNLCAGDNNSLHPFMNPCKSPWLITRIAAFSRVTQQEGICLACIWHGNLGSMRSANTLRGSLQNSQAAKRDTEMLSSLYRSAITNPIKKGTAGRTFYSLSFIWPQSLTLLTGSSLSSPHCFQQRHIQHKKKTEEGRLIANFHAVILAANVVAGIQQTFIFRRN